MGTAGATQFYRTMCYKGYTCGLQLHLERIIRDFTLLRHPRGPSYQLRCYASAREKRRSWHTHTHLTDPPSCSVRPLRRKEKWLVTSSSSRDLTRLPSSTSPFTISGGNGNTHFAWADSCSSHCSKMQRKLIYPPVSPWAAPALALADTDADVRDLSSAYLQGSASAS